MSALFHLNLNFNVLLNFSEWTTDSQPKDSQPTSTLSTNMVITMFCVLILLILGLAIALVITRGQTNMVEMGRVFRNQYYGLYYKGDVRIDQGVVEVVDKNPNYDCENDEPIDTAIEDTNPHYNGGTGTREMIVEEDGYARIAGSLDGGGDEDPCVLQDSIDKVHNANINENPVTESDDTKEPSSEVKLASKLVHLIKSQCRKQSRLRLREQNLRIKKALSGIKLFSYK